MNTLTNHLIDLSILAIFGILYMFFFAKLKNLFFLKFGEIKNQSVMILYLGSLTAAAINLLFFLSQNSFLWALVYASSFFVGIWIFSAFLFRLSFIVISQLTKDDETTELIKNNTELAWLHVIILNAITFVIAPALVQIAVSFIPYPKLPF
jgi:hypothetical protein